MSSFWVWFPLSFFAICLTSCFRMNDVLFEIRGFDGESATCRWEIRKVGGIPNTFTVTVRPVVAEPDSAVFFSLGGAYQYPWSGSEESVLVARLAIQANELRISSGDSSTFVYNLSSPINAQPVLNNSEGKILRIEGAQDFLEINEGAMILLPLFDSSDEDISFDIFLILQIDAL